MKKPVLKPSVTILIPHFRTLDLTRLCLRLIRKYTEPSQIQVIVIDNDSRDESLAYLPNLSWIRFRERTVVPDEGSITAHSRALDLGLQEVETPYVLSIHTDTLVKHPHWLDFLLMQIERSPTIAGVGSWKLECKPLWRQVLKTVERNIQRVFQWKKAREFHYLRSHCALYRMDLLRKFHLHFSDGSMIAGMEIHKQLTEAGYEMIFLPSSVLGKYVDHINHATSVLNPELSLRMRGIDKGLKRLQQVMMRMNEEGILNDTTLDG